MKCKVCGHESGKYPLCRACNSKKENGEIIKCERCLTWHHVASPCSPVVVELDNHKYLYEVRDRLISKSEQEFYEAIKKSLPGGYCVFPQINLASFIERTDHARFHNELFRNVDFLVVDFEYRPKLIIEINDQTHLNAERKDRDEKVRKICEEAGIPILKLWTSYGVNQDYINSKIEQIINGTPALRIHHFNQNEISQQVSEEHKTKQQSKKKKGCYVASCVYGSYDCPQVWMLRRYRDQSLMRNWYGRLFVKIYYCISPILVKHFGNKEWFKRFWKKCLDLLTQKLRLKGFEDTPYND